MKTIFIRTDFGTVIGDGHLFRTKALAAAFLEKGHRVIYVTRPHEGFVANKIDPFESLLLSPSKATPQRGQPSTWLCRTELEDAEECLQLVRSYENGIWVVDHYAIGPIWEKKLQSHGYKVLAIDDLCRAHHCNAVLDHNLNAMEVEYVKASNPTNMHYLMGPQYALLRREIIDAPQHHVSNSDERMLVYLGSCSPEVFSKVIGILKKLYDLPIDVLAPPAGVQLQAETKSIPFQQDIASIYNDYRWVVGSCGVANLERMALQVPTLTCGVVENQSQVSKYLESRFPNMHLGMITEISEEQIAEKLSQILKREKASLAHHIQKLATLVAKDGASKVASFMVGL